MKYFKKLVGMRVYLSPINTDDVEIFTKWLNDHDVSSNLGGMFAQMISLNSEKKSLEGLASEGQNYAIVLLENDTMIGDISLHRIDEISRAAEVGLLIGEAEYRGKGYGAEALRLILDYGFKTMNLHNIMLLVHSNNEQAIACYKKVGFRKFGSRREARFTDGKYIDDEYMDILDTEFYRDE
jgi:RimJ/RimL family protein N-acetyltransferase